MNNNELLDVGFQNFIDCQKIMAIGNPNSAPIKRFVKQSKEANRYIDLSEGKKTRSIIIQDGKSGLVAVASYRMPRTIKLHMKHLIEGKKFDKHIK